MDLSNQTSNPNCQGDLSGSRKRGRPLKYPMIEDDFIGGNDVLVPPGFKAIKKQRQRHKKNDSNLKDITEGQGFSGVVVQKLIGDGLLVDIKVSGIQFRGAVFMCKCNNPEIDGIPSHTQVQTHLPRMLNEQHVNVNIHTTETLTRNVSPLVNQVPLPRGATSSSNLATSCGMNVPSVVDQTTLLARGKGIVTPVSVQPSQIMRQASLGSGMSISGRGTRKPSVADQTSLLVQGRGKVTPVFSQQVAPPIGVPDSIQPYQGRGASISSRGTPIDGNQQLLFLNQTRPSPALRTQVSLQRETSSTNNVSVHENQTISSRTPSQNMCCNQYSTYNVSNELRQPSWPFDFEMLVNEVVKRVQARIGSADSGDAGSGRTIMKGSTSGQEQCFIDLESGQMVTPTSTQPPQDAQFGPHSASSSIPSKSTGPLQDKQE